MTKNQTTKNGDRAAAIVDVTCPGGYFPDVWVMFDSGWIDYQLEVAQDIAEEFTGLYGVDFSDDVRLIVKAALHDGFCRGVDYIRQMIGDPGTAPPGAIGGQEAPNKPMMVAQQNTTVVKSRKTRHYSHHKAIGTVFSVENDKTGITIAVTGLRLKRDSSRAQ